MFAKNLFEDVLLKSTQLSRELSSAIDPNIILPVGGRLFAYDTDDELLDRTRDDVSAF